MLIGKISDDLCPITALLSYLYSIQRGRARLSISLGVRNPTVQICGACTRWAQEGKTPSLGLFRSQLPHWGSNYTAAVIGLEDSAIHTLD